MFSIKTNKTHMKTDTKKIPITIYFLSAAIKRESVNHQINIRKKKKKLCTLSDSVQSLDSRHTSEENESKRRLKKTSVEFRGKISD